MVVVAFCACVVLAVDILNLVMNKVPIEAWIVGYNVNRSAAHGILTCNSEVALFIILM